MYICLWIYESQALTVASHWKRITKIMIIIHAHKVHLQFTSSKKQNRKSLTQSNIFSKLPTGKRNTQRHIPHPFSKPNPC